MTTARLHLYQAVRPLVKKHGGQWHGPHVETLSMPETKFYEMLEDPEFVKLFQRQDFDFPHQRTVWVTPKGVAIPDNPNLGKTIMAHKEPGAVQIVELKEFKEGIGD